LKRIIPFLDYKFLAFGLSLAMLVVFSAGTIINGGLNFGVDFVGGVKIVAKFDGTADEAGIRDVLKDLNPMVQQIGQDEKNEFIVSTKLASGKTSSEADFEKVKKLIQSRYKNVEFLNIENVGPAIGNFLKKSAIKLFFVALIIMTIYLAFRFQFKYSVGTMAAILHDILLSIVFCGITGIEFNIPVVAALLTIFGYSVNDTIVIFDRIRENVQIQSKQTFDDVINRSISQSLSRTLLTSLTTLFAVLSLYLLGGEGLNDFAAVLLFGIFVGTYSSIYIASPVLIYWERAVSR